MSAEERLRMEKVDCLLIGSSIPLTFRDTIERNLDLCLDMRARTWFVTLGVS